MSNQQYSESDDQASKPIIDDEVKKNVKSRNTWMRFFYMFVFVLLMALAEFVLAVVVVLQFFTVLFTGKRNAQLLTFGRDLASYVFDIWRYLVFATEEQPFPFSDWQSSTSDEETASSDASERSSVG